MVVDFIDSYTGKPILSAIFKGGLISAVIMPILVFFLTVFYNYLSTPVLIVSLIIMLGMSLGIVSSLIIVLNRIVFNTETSLNMVWITLANLGMFAIIYYLPHPSSVAMLLITGSLPLILASALYIFTIIKQTTPKPIEGTL